MMQAEQGLIETIDTLNFCDPNMPIIANSTSRPLTTADEVREELIAGLCHCVKWKHSVRYMVDSGISTFVEFGPSRVLSSLIKRIDQDVEAVTLSDFTSMKKLGEGVA